MRRHQELPPDPQRPLWRLILSELAYLVRQFLRPRHLVPALLAAGVISLGLSPATPGPVLDPGPLAFLAVAGACTATWLAAKLAVENGETRSRRSGFVRQATSGIGMVVLTAGLVALAGWLLAVVVSLLF